MQRTQLTSPSDRELETPTEIVTAPTLLEIARAIFNQAYTEAWKHEGYDRILCWGEAYVNIRLFREEAADPASEWDTHTLEEIAEILCNPSRPWEGIVDEEGIDQHEGA